ncbi:MAG: UDP-N-acetylmuramate dehydrogenase [Solirubrobacterales bacterium]|nr:UDP-N-acetylmuramate dehydrogenase [Solirubrobacterales bacterium]
MRERRETSLSGMTTLRVGGPARRMLDASVEEEVVEAVSGADAAGESLLVMAGGSNLVIADAGFPGTVARIATSGIAARSEDDRVRFDVAAGETWDELVARCVADELAGIECLSGIPGSVGATPIQNVGAYGQEVSETIASVRTYDRRAGAVAERSPAQCAFGYRSSAFKGSDRHVVLAVSLVLERSAAARPIRYAELARTLGVELGSRPPATDVREAVLALRRRKGMVIDPDDPDSVSAGSFFVNPILSTAGFAALTRRAAERLGEGSPPPPGWPEADGHVKTSAAWLIERAGFHRGYGGGRAGISQKHTLAIVNRGGATTSELIAVARELRRGVAEAFGVTLQVEPTLVGVAL